MDKGKTVSVRLHSYTKAIIDLVIAEQSMTQGQKLTNDGAILYLASKDPELMKRVKGLQGVPPKGIDIDKRHKQSDE